MRNWLQLESEVRSYCRSMPATFATAKNSTLEDEQGRTYIDFLAGAGSLNYGHNNARLKQRLASYLDMASSAKKEFLEALERNVLYPREMDYKVQFTGPTGTNAVEAALKIARKVTGREKIVAFTNGFHGVSLGSLAATANNHYRKAAGVSLDSVAFFPYENYAEGVDGLALLDQMLLDKGSGLDLPAAVIVEAVQGEGGIRAASPDWLSRLQDICEKHGILLILDDIQMGCGRTGTFFSFEEASIVPDIVTLSKSLSGYGLPFSLVLLKPKWDQWEPGEHNGTFRGHNLAFVTAKAALDTYWKDDSFSNEVRRKGAYVRGRFKQIQTRLRAFDLKVRGRGMVYGLDCKRTNVAAGICKAAFQKGLIVETSGAKDHVVKFLAPLTIDDDTLAKGLDILEESCMETLLGKKLIAFSVKNTGVLAR